MIPISGGLKIEVEGAKASEVREVATALLSATQRHSGIGRINPRTLPWLSGSFYLFAVLVLVLAALTVAKTVDWLVLPGVLIFGLLAVSVIGALQLRHDDRLSENGFLKLMIESLKRLPLLRRGETRSTKLR
jgi:hypothetical protein